MDRDSDNDLFRVAREFRHPWLWAGLGLQLVAVAVLARTGEGWYTGDSAVTDVLPGALTAVLPVAGVGAAARWPRRPDPGAVDAAVAGAPWLRALWLLAVPFAVGPFLLFGGSVPDDSLTSSLVLSAGLGDLLLPLLAVMLVVGPVLLVTDVRRPGVRAHPVDVLAVGALLPAVLLFAAIGAWASPEATSGRSAALAQWVGIVLGAIDPREPWLAWLLRAATVLFLVLLWRTAVLSRRALAARRSRAT